jgi:hypothetical protein
MALREDFWKKEKRKKVVLFSVRLFYGVKN